LKEDVEAYAKKANSHVEPVLNSVTIPSLETLLKKLLERHSLDGRFITRTTKTLLRLANHVNPNPPRNASPAEEYNHRQRLSVLLARDKGQVPMLWLALIIGTILSSKGFEELKKLNPFLSDLQIKTLESLTAALMLVVNRLGQLARCISDCVELLSLLRKGSSQDAIELSSDALAKQLCTKRHYITKSSNSGGFVYDPRFLVFEFMHDIVLRKSQVDLIEEFKIAIVNKDSRCNQMLMGAGKTTVVAPLLALLLGDGKKLVAQVVPRALFDFSCNVMRSRFSAILQKQVYTFAYDRFKPPEESLLRKLKKAKSSRGIVIATPTTLKSFALKFVETCNAIQETKRALHDNSKEPRTFSLLALVGKKTNQQLEDESLQSVLSSLQKQARLCCQILTLFKEGTLLLDEVDLILHPLKSELNWPMGRKDPLDFTRKGIRWDIAFFLIDGMMQGSGASTSTSNLEDSMGARKIIEELKREMTKGIEENEVQVTPHMVIVSPSFYHQKIKLLIAKWGIHYLRMKKVVGDEKMLLQYIMGGNGNSTADYNQQQQVLSSLKLSGLGQDQVQILNLMKEWICSYLLNVLKKINRVHYGLLQPLDLKRALAIDPNTPESRRLLAVPFVGKDVPSMASEFAHPDIVIGLAGLAYRYEGLRFSDFIKVLSELRGRLENESGPYKKRTTTLLYNNWVKYAGGKVRGTKDERDYQENDALLGAELVAVTDELSAAIERAELSVRPDEDLFNDLWPLHLVDLRDEDQVNALYRLLYKLPHVVEYYLRNFVFPVTCRHQGVKLSACGQALGGDMVFQHRFGFSGTPSDLLPKELGRCHYEKGSDAKMMHFLTDTNVTSYEYIHKGWGVNSLLDKVASTDSSALIDTGALITGMSNYQVAMYLLQHGLSGKDGVVFLDEMDRKMILVRKGYMVMKLAQCGVPLERRFAFYDQIHTTGMDIKHVLDAKAILTLGKDMTFRDYAQGAFRMRGIGKGQTVNVYIVPEVKKLIDGTDSGGGGGGNSNNVLSNVSAWLVVNSMRSETLQQNLLLEQSMKNVWRKRAYECLKDDYVESIYGSNPNHLNKQKLNVNKSLDIFRERVDYHISNKFSDGMNKTLLKKLKDLAQEHHKIIYNEDQVVVDGLVNECRKYLPEHCGTKLPL